MGFLFFLLFFSLATLTNSCFNDDDIKIVSSILRYFDKEQYILVSKHCDSITLIPKLKSLSRKNLVGIYFKFKMLFEYLQLEKFPIRRTMIIIKTHDDEELRMIMENLREKVRSF